MNNFKKRKLGGFDSIKGIGAIGIGDIVGKSIAGVFWIYVASVLTPEEFGEISYLMSIAATCSIFAAIGTQNTITTFTAKKIELVKTLSIFSIISSIFGTVVLLLLFERLDIGILSIGFVLNNLVIGNLLGRKKFSTYSILQALQKVLVIILGLIAIHLFSYEGLIFALAFSYLIFIIGTFRILKETEFNWNLLKQKWKFIANNYLMRVLGSLGNQVDKILVMPLLGAAILGNYSLGLQVLVVCNSISTIIFKFILPYDSTNVSTQQVKKYLIIISVGIAALGYFLLPEIMPILFPEYSGVSHAIQILVLTVIPSSFLVIFSSKFLSLEKTGILLVGNGVSLTTMVVGVISLGTIYGITGLFWTVILSTTFNALVLILYYKKLGYNFSDI